MKNNLYYIKSAVKKNKITHKELAALTEYSLDSVKAWLSDPKSERWRPVPDRAVSILKLKKLK